MRSAAVLVGARGRVTGVLVPTGVHGASGAHDLGAHAASTGAGAVGETLLIRAGRPRAISRAGSMSSNPSGKLGGFFFSRCP